MKRIISVFLSAAVALSLKCYDAGMFFDSETGEKYIFYSKDIGIDAIHDKLNESDEWTAIGETLQMAYDWPDFMGYRFGLFVYATKETGGYADFDYMRFDDKLVNG